MCARVCLWPFNVNKHSNRPRLQFPYFITSMKRRRRRRSRSSGRERINRNMRSWLQGNRPLWLWIVESSQFCLVHTYMYVVGILLKQSLFFAGRLRAQIFDFFSLGGRDKFKGSLITQQFMRAQRHTHALEGSCQMGSTHSCSSCGNRPYAS